MTFSGHDDSTMLDRPWIIIIIIIINTRTVSLLKPTEDKDQSHKGTRLWNALSDDRKSLLSARKFADCVKQLMGYLMLTLLNFFPLIFILLQLFLRCSLCCCSLLCFVPDQVLIYHASRRLKVKR